MTRSDDRSSPGIDIATNRPESNQGDTVWVGGRRFSVVRAVLDANLTEDRAFWWRLIVYAKGFGWYYDREEEIVAYCHFIPLEGKRLQRWQDAVSSGFRWDDSYDDSSGERWACICLGGPHDHIDNGILGFGPPKGSRFQIEWSGIADVDPPEELEDLEEIEFLCKAEVEFVGVIVSGIDPDVAPKRISEFLCEPTYILDDSRAGGVGRRAPSDFYLPHEP